MDDLKETMYVWLSDEGNRIILLFVLASGLGLVSLLFFFATDAGSPTRLQFGLIVAAMVVVFYLSLRSTIY